MTNYRPSTNFHLNLCIPSCSGFPNLHCLFLLQSRRNVLCFFSSCLLRFTGAIWGVLADGVSTTLEGWQLYFSRCFRGQVERESISRSPENPSMIWKHSGPEFCKLPACRKTFLKYLFRECIIMLYSFFFFGSKAHCALYRKSPKALSLAIKLSLILAFIWRQTFPEYLVQASLAGCSALLFACDISSQTRWRPGNLLLCIQKFFLYLTLDWNRSDNECLSWCSHCVSTPHKFISLNTGGFIILFV